MVTSSGESLDVSQQVKDLMETGSGHTKTVLSGRLDQILLGPTGPTQLACGLVQTRSDLLASAVRTQRTCRGELS